MENNNTNYDYATPQFAESYTGSDEDFDYFEEVDLDSIEFEADGLSEMDTLRIEIDDELEQTLQEMEELEKDLEEGQAGKLADAIKENVMSTIKGQFGIASLLIESKDGGSVTTAHNFKQGITATEADAKRYEGWQEANSKSGDDWQNYRKKSGYDTAGGKSFTDYRKEKFQQEDKIISGYTGKELTKDGKTHVEHIVSAHEVATDPKNHLFKDAEGRVQMATSEENLCWLEGSINQSKGDKKLENWMDEKKKGFDEDNAERFGVDREMASAAGKEARKHIKKEVNVAKAKKYTKELVTTGAKDSLKTGVYAMFVPLLTDVAKAVFDELKAAIALRKEGKKWKEVLKHFKERIGIVIENIKTKIKAEWDKIVGNGAWAAVTAFLSNIVVFLINTFATTLKKIVSMIRAGFASIVQAFRTVTTNPQKLSDEDKWFEAGKILATGVIGAVSLGLSAALETLITTTIPFLAPISNIVSTVLSAIGGGIVSSILVYYMDKAHARNQKDKLQIQLVNKSGQVVKIRVLQTMIAVSDAYGGVIKVAKTLEAANHKFIETVTESHEMIVNTKKEMAGISAQTWKELDEGWNF